MKEPITSYIGLDIHKESIAMAIAEADRAAPRFIGTINPVPAELCKAMRRVCTKESTLVVYEAGPCGYGWVRYLRKQGWACDVIAPSRITRKPSEKRIKTDRRDALLLARESRSGNLTSIVVPDERDEAIRDLVRAREDARIARQRVRLQMQAMMLRHGRHYQGKKSWSQAHDRYLSTIRFEHPAQELAFNEYRLASKEACERLERITEALRVQCEDWRMNPLVKALMCLNVSGDLISVEIGRDGRRDFVHPFSSDVSYLNRLVMFDFDPASSPRGGGGAIARARSKCALHRGERWRASETPSAGFAGSYSRLMRVIASDKNTVRSEPAEPPARRRDNAAGSRSRATGITSADRSTYSGCGNGGRCIRGIGAGIGVRGSLRYKTR